MVGFIIQTREWEKILEAQDPTVATVTFDFCMKWMPKWHHETTAQWYGKRGVSYDIFFHKCPP